MGATMGSTPRIKKKRKRKRKGRARGDEEEEEYEEEYEEEEEVDIGHKRASPTRPIHLLARMPDLGRSGLRPCDRRGGKETQKGHVHP